MVLSVLLCCAHCQPQALLTFIAFRFYSCNISGVFQSVKGIQLAQGGGVKKQELDQNESCPVKMEIISAAPRLCPAQTGGRSVPGFCWWLLSVLAKPAPQLGRRYWHGDDRWISWLCSDIVGHFHLSFFVLETVCVSWECLQDFYLWTPQPVESANKAASGGWMWGRGKAYLCSFIMGRIPFAWRDSLAGRDVKPFWWFPSTGRVFLFGAGSKARFQQGQAKHLLFFNIVQHVSLVYIIIE